MKHSGNITAVFIEVRFFWTSKTFWPGKSYRYFGRDWCPHFQGLCSPRRAVDWVNPEDGKTKQLRKYRKNFLLYIMSSVRRRQHSWTRDFQNLGVNDKDFGYVKSTYITSIFWKITRKEDTWKNKEYMEKIK